MPSSSKLSLALAAASLAACREPGDTKSNAEPTAEIRSHAAADTVREGYPETLTGTVGDPDHAMDALTVAWVVDGVEVCADSAPDAEGTVSCAHTFGPTGGVVQLDVRDPDGGAGSATVALDVQPTDAPVAVLTAPTPEGVHYTDPPTTLAGVISDAEDDVSELTVAWSSSLDGALSGDFTVPDPDGALQGAAILSEGEHVLTLTVTDRTGKQGQDSTTIQVGPANSNPTCGITAPEDGGVSTEGEAVSFTALVGDVDVPSDWLTVVWESDIDGVLDTTAPDADGVVAFVSDALTIATHAISLTVTDEVGATCSAAILHTVGTPPMLSVTSPASGDVVNETAAVSFAATVSDNEDPATDIALSWSSDVDGEFSTQGADAVGSIAFDTAALSAGDHSVTVRATDTDGLYAQTTLDLTINQVPTAPTVSISPDPAYTVDTLTASASGSRDPDDSGPVTHAYAWSVDGVASSVSAAATFPSSATQKGSTYRVVVTPSDGTGTGPTGEASLTVQNTAPVLSGPTLSAAVVQVGDTLTCSGSATDVDAVDTPTVAYAWSDGSTGATYTVTSADTVGGSITCTATADDGDGGTDTASAAATVANTDPVMGTVSVSPTTGQVGDVLTCSAAATDVDGGTPTVDYSWSDGSTGAAYTIAASDDPGDAITCTATATDADGGSDSGTASATVTNTPPVVGAVTISPATGRVGDVLTCTGAATDADGDAPALAYAWSDGSAGPTYTVVDTDDPGDVLVCTVTATDPDGGADSDTASATVENTDPVMGTVSVSPSTGQVGDVLTCSASATDADGGAPAISYGWTDGSTAATYTIQDTDDPGDVITCTATATDGSGGSDSDAASATVENTDPVMGTVSVSPTTGQVGDVLTCSAAATDADGGTPVLTYAWSGGAAGAAYTIVDTDDPGDVLTCTATATDADGGTASDAATATVENTDPVLGAVTISPTSAHNDEALTCSASATDGDGGTPTVTYAWAGSVAGSLGTGSTVDLSVTAVASSETVTCTATASDPDGGSDSGSADLVVSNRAPTVSVSLSPGTGAVAADTLTCTASASDADADALTTSFDWTVDGSTVSASSTTAATSTLAGAFVYGDVVACTATTTDGKGGSSADTASSTITNTPPTVSAATLSPSTVYTDDTLTADVTTSDDDGATVTVTYDWYVDGSVVQSGASKSLSGATYFDRGQQVYVVATADDGTDTTSVTSSTVTIANSPPTAPLVAIDLSDPIPGTEFVCEVITGSTDADGDAVTYSMTWTVDGAAYSGATTQSWSGDTIDGADTAADEVWTCTATPDDGYGTGSTATDSVTIQPCASAYLDGSNDHITLGEPGSLSFVLDSDSSIEFWVKPAAHTGSILFNYGDFEGARDNEALSANLTSAGRVSLQFRGPSSSMSITSTSSLPVDMWSHVHIQREMGVGSRLYIDGVLEASSSSTAGTLSFAYSQEWTLGSRYKYDSGAYVGHFEGQFAEFRVWSDIRSPAEVVDAASAAEIDTAWEADLAGQWALSEGAGTALVDAVGAAADGVVMDGASAGASWLEECLLNDDDEDGYLVWEDCDDGDASVYPLGGDTYGDGIDSDCDGLDCEAASDGSVYMAVCPGAETWTSALSECSAAAYSSLATILSSSEHAFVEGLILAQAGAGGSEFWFGLNQRSLPESDWEFESGISWSYSNWYPGEPDDNGGADCGRLLSTHGYRWGDAPCSNSAGFICEFR